MKAGLEHLAACDRRLRPTLVRLPGDLPIRLYSEGRRRALERFAGQAPKTRPVPDELARTLWGLRFRSPILNAAGMFKKGEGYNTVAAQGAGGYLAGTTTAAPRRGNRRHGIQQPFAPYPRSGAASNWLGLPNPGHQAVAGRLSGLEKIEGCPLGASLAADPGAPTSEAQDGLIAGLEGFTQAGVDFVEINESCPNTEADSEADAAFDGFAARLKAISERFLRYRTGSFPVLVKLSTDTEFERLPALIDLLIELGFDGLTLGNTSTNYAGLRQQISPSERRLFDRFTRRYGGGLSGRPLGPRALKLIRTASGHLRRRGDVDAFHLIRVGGVESAQDVAASLEAGASLVQWYTGYFEAFGAAGHDLYSRLYSELL